MISVENKKVWIYGAVLIAITLTFALYRYFSVRDIDPSTSKTIEVTDQSNAKIEIDTNPVKNVPDLDPTEKINPFKTKNPFE